MINFLNLEPETFGLDINDTSLKIIKLRKKHGFLRPVSFNEKEIPEGIIKSGVILDEDAFVKKATEALASVKGEKLRTRYVIASLPEEKSFSQVIQMPKMEEKELESAIPFEIENYIPLSTDQIYLDFKEINSILGQYDHMDILVTAVEKTVVDSYISVLRKADLIPVSFEVETQSIARVLVKDEKNLKPIAIVDFGGDNTVFIVFSGHSVRFTSSIPVSSRQITNTVSEELGITLKEAEHLKAKYGIGLSRIDHRAKAVLKATTPILEALVQEIEKYIDFYSDHDFYEHFLKENGKKNIEKIILSRGGADLKGIDEFLRKNLNIAVEFGDPWINFPEKLKAVLPRELREKSSSYITALGLALGKADDD